ncbi:MAG TPA: alpha/beta fold hydrolase [Anaerolineales bacterium]|nr:alpha/beta fold hydrolase [Anaerolineales bacterium]
MTNMQIRDVSLFVKIMGQGYPLVLMHGGPSLDHTTLLPLQPLADHFTLVFYDHRCNGRSDGSDVTTMTWENLTADADALRQELGFDQWVVLGQSFGGNVALEYALRYPHSLSHLILMNTGGDQWWVNHNAPEILAKRGFSAAAVDAARRFYNGNLTPNEYLPTVMKLIGAYSYHSSIWYHPTLMTLAQKIGLGPPMKLRPEALIFGYSELLNGWTVMDRLGEIKVPTLVVAGRYDFLFPPEHQAILADRLPNARLELIERAGHNPQMEQTAEVLRIIKDFLADMSQS